MRLQFEWSSSKATANLAKHRVSFDEGMSVFGDPIAKIFDDDKNFVRERREIIIGHSAKFRLLVVCFVESEDKVRLISARKATRHERTDYEENTSS